jgi:hypothetical protein
MPPAVPDLVRRTLTADVVRELAVAFDDQVVFPERVLVDEVGVPDRRFPGWPGPVLVISVENQGVCAWGVPLGQEDPVVVVGGQLLDHGDATVEYAPGVAAFVEARRWDRDCLCHVPLVQAQADPLDPASLGHLQAHFGAGPTTVGWPAGRQLRFERGGCRLMLWSGADQCDWWVSGPEPELRDVVEELLPLSNLRRALWSNDDAGETLLAALDVEGPWLDGL